MESISIGRNATATANNQFVLGAASYGITALYLGEGVTSATAAAADVKLQATGGLGTDIGGADFTIAGGQGTGTGTGGSIIFQVSDDGTTGSALNALTTVASIDQNGKFVLQNSTDSTTGFQVLDTDGGNPVFSVDTTNETVGIGIATQGVYDLYVRDNDGEAVVVIEGSGGVFDSLINFFDGVSTDWSIGFDDSASVFSISESATLGTSQVLGIASGGYATFANDIAVQGGDLTLGVASTTNGTIVLQNSTNAFTTTINAPNQLTGSTTISLPNTGADTADTFCLVVWVVCRLHTTPAILFLRLTQTGI